MNNLPRLLLLLLMGGSLLAARWTNGLGQRRSTAVLVRPRPPVGPIGPWQAWLPYGNWPGWVLTAGTKAPAMVSDSAPATHSL